MSLFAVHPPYYRVERATGAASQVDEAAQEQLHLLAAPHPAHGWPLGWVFVPVQADLPRSPGSSPALPGTQRLHWRVNTLHWLPFAAAPQEGSPPHARPAPVSRAQRLSLPLAWWRRRGGGRQELLCLLVYWQGDDSPGFRSMTAQAGSAHFHADEDSPAQGPWAGALRDAIAARLAHTPASALVHGLVRLPRLEAPRRTREPLNFALASCQFPAHLLDRSAADATEPERAGVAEASLARLSRYCNEHPRGRRTRLLLLAGDAIYADPTFGLFDPRNANDRFDRRYDRLKSGVLRHLPPSLERIVSAPDDHEFHNNLDTGLTSSHRSSELREAGAAAWLHTFDAIRRPGHGQHFWHQFQHQGASFFVADSRTERSPRPLHQAAQAHLLGESQRAAISTWLAQTRGQPRFFMSAALLVPRRRESALHPSGAIRSDAWCGYPASLHWLLGELWLQRADHVVFLSGDEHRSGWVRARLEEVGGHAPALNLLSVHSSGLYSPWAFTVTAAQQFAAPDDWCFEPPQPDLRGKTLRCRVEVWHDHPGEGFVALQLRGDTLRCWFHRAQAGTHPSHPGPRHRAPDAQIRWRHG